jgi:hypothetical protein
MVIKKKIEIKFDLDIFTISNQKQENRATLVTKKDKEQIKLKFILPYIQSRKSNYLLS